MSTGHHDGYCGHCFEYNGFHKYGCPSLPKKGNKTCGTCHGWNGFHETSCATKGYQVPARRDPPPAAPTGLPEMCCGGVATRATCPYHMSTPDTERSGHPNPWGLGT